MSPILKDSNGTWLKKLWDLLAGISVRRIAAIDPSMCAGEEVAGEWAAATMRLHTSSNSSTISTTTSNSSQIWARPSTEGKGHIPILLFCDGSSKNSRSIITSSRKMGKV